MADAALARVLLQYYNQGSTANPTINFAPADGAPVSPTKTYQARVSAALAGTTIGLAPFTTILAFAAKNLDSANLVEVAFTYTDQGAVDRTCKVALPYGQVMLLSSTMKVSANVVLTGFTAAVNVDVAIIGT